MSRFSLRLESMSVILLLMALVGSLFPGCKGKPQQSTAEEQSKQINGSGQPEPSKFETVAIPEGTSITVRLQQSVSSRSARSGDTFEAEVVRPVVVDGFTVIPELARVQGQVVAAAASGRLQKPGYVDITLVSLQTADGEWVSIDTNAISRHGKSHKKRNLTLIGGGSGLGAVIGAIAGGGKGAAIGAVAGAGAGTAGAYATGEKDVSFPAESKVTFRLQRPLELSQQQTAEGNKAPPAPQDGLPQS